MFKKLFIVLSISLCAFQNISLAQANGLCQTIKDEAQRLCNACQENGNIKVETNPMLAGYFQKEEYQCRNLSPIISSQTNLEYFFGSNPPVNCQNIQQTICESDSKDIPEVRLTPSDSEFFNVLDPNSGLVAQSNQGTSFQIAVEENGPILGPILLIINFLTGIIATLAILALVVGGLFMVTARGEESQISRGKDIVKNSLLAIVIVLGSYTLIRTIQATILLILN